MRLQSDAEDRHASEIEQKNIDIAELTDMVEELATRLRDLEVIDTDFSLIELLRAIVEAHIRFLSVFRMPIILQGVHGGFV